MFSVHCAILKSHAFDLKIDDGISSKNQDLQMHEAKV